MKGYFTRTGKYGSAAGASVEVSKADVEKKKIFEIAPEYAGYFIEAGAFVAGNVKAEEPPAEPKAVGGMTVAELKAYAAEKEIDLGEASKKDEILAVIVEAEKPPEGDE